MDVNFKSSAISAILLVMAAASLLTMLSLNQINYIIQGDLPNFGLQFSYRWAMPYWVLSGIIFGLSWLNIAISIIATFYVFRKSRKQTQKAAKVENVEASVQPKEDKEQRQISEFLESKREEVVEPKEERAQATSEQIVLEAVEQPVEQPTEQPTETAETPAQEAQETQEPPPAPQPEQQTAESVEPSEPSAESEEAPIPSEDAEKQSVL